MDKIIMVAGEETVTVWKLKGGWCEVDVAGGDFDGTSYTPEENFDETVQFYKDLGFTVAS